MRDMQLDQFWYHTIELSPGIYTPGQDYFNIAATRAILKKCELKGKRCLDIGTADGLTSVLLCRRGAAEVYACDRHNRSHTINAVKDSLDVNFTYLSNSTIADVRRKLPTLTTGALDLIVFSGVLYHMYDPMSGLGLVRSMARAGGLVVIESNAVVSPHMTAYFNAAGYIENDCHNYWNLGVTLIDYLCRYFRLMPLDCCYIDIPGHAPTEDGSKVIRLCTVSRAVDEPMPDAEDNWMKSQRDDDVEYPQWAAAKANEPPVEYASPSEQFLRPSGAVNLYQMVTNTPSLAYGKSEVRLAYDAVY
jgi:hypothetical protein